MTASLSFAVRPEATMTELTSAIVAHDLDGIEKVILENPSQVNVPVMGWLPIDWAKRTGNFVTVVRLLRCIGEKGPREEFTKLLHDYIELLTEDEFEPCSLTEGASMAWDAAYHGKIHKIGRWKRNFVSSPQQAQDIRFLIERCGLNSRKALIEELKKPNNRLVSDAGSNA